MLKILQYIFKVKIGQILVSQLKCECYIKNSDGDIKDAAMLKILKYSSKVKISQILVSQLKYECYIKNPDVDENGIWKAFQNF